MLVEPRAFDVEQLEAGEAGECERVDGELRDRLVGPRVGLVIQNVNGAVSDLEKIEMAGDRRGAPSSWATSSIAYSRSIASMSASVSHIGISTASVTLSLASMKRWSVS